MGANTFSRVFRVTTAGESHGPAMVCVIDGCPAGMELSAQDIEKELARRRPGGAYGSRDEEDAPVILSGVFEGRTLGTPIAIMVCNKSQDSAAYEELKDVYRPGHADYTWEAKFGRRDRRGGGRSSGRETLCRVAAGAVAKKLLALSGIAVRAWTSSIAGLCQPGPLEAGFDFEEIERNSLRVPCKAGAAKAAAKLEEIRAQGDSAGGVVSCLITGAPAGLGEPVFDKLDARLACAVLSIGACKGIEFGAGFAAAATLGSEHNASAGGDRSGGILGGISTGGDIAFRAAFKPTPSIAKPQQALDREGRTREIAVKGRHDVCIAPRAVPVVEAMAALVLADCMLLSRLARV